MLLSITNGTTHTFSVQDPTGLSGLSVTVPGSTTKSNISISALTLASIQPLLDASVSAGYITYVVSEDTTSLADKELSRVRTATTTPVTVAATDETVVTNLTVPGAVAVSLPAALPVGTVVEIYDGKGDAAANNVTITPVGGTINGAANVVLNVNNTGVRLVKVTSTAWLKMPGSTSVPSGAAGGDLTGTYPNPTVDALVLDGSNMNVVTDADTAAGVPVVYTYTIADGATANYDITLDEKTEVMEVTVVKTGGAGGAGDTVTLKNGTDAITDAMDANVSDKTVIRPTTVDDAYSAVAAAGTLRVAVNNGGLGNAAMKVYVRGVKRA